MGLMHHFDIREGASRSSATNWKSVASFPLGSVATAPAAELPGGWTCRLGRDKVQWLLCGELSGSHLISSWYNWTSIWSLAWVMHPSASTMGYPPNSTAIPPRHPILSSPSHSFQKLGANQLFRFPPNVKEPSRFRFRRKGGWEW